MSSEPLTWIHLSDVHMGHGDAHDGYDQDIVLGRLREDARTLRKSIGPPDYVMLTGDLAFSGRAEQYEGFRGWLGKFLSELDASPLSVLLVPGNHDVDRSKVAGSPASLAVHKDLRQNPRQLSAFLKCPVDLKAMLWPKLQAYADFAAAYGAPPLSCERPFWFRTIEHPLGPIIAVGLNTCLLSYDSADSQQNLALGLGQLSQLIEQQPRDALLLVLQHHPPEWLTDGDDLRSLLGERAHLLFCGHVHRQGGARVQAFSGQGLLQLTAGAVHSDPGAPPRHAYSWGRLSADGLEYFPRLWEPDLQKFVPAPGYKVNEQGAFLFRPDELQPQLRDTLQVKARARARTEPASAPTFDLAALQRYVYIYLFNTLTPLEKIGGLPSFLEMLKTEFTSATAVLDAISTLFERYGFPRLGPNMRLYFAYRVEPHDKDRPCYRIGISNSRQAAWMQGVKTGRNSNCHHVYSTGERRLISDVDIVPEKMVDRVSDEQSVFSFPVLIGEGWACVGVLGLSNAGVWAKEGKEWDDYATLGRELSVVCGALFYAYSQTLLRRNQAKAPFAREAVGTVLETIRDEISDYYERLFAPLDERAASSASSPRRGGRDDSSPANPGR